MRAQTPTSELLAYQRDGVQALLAHPSILLADDMGLGKTVQAITALHALVDQGLAASTLVVAPVGLLAQWRAELWRWAPELSAICVDGSSSERRWKWNAAKQIYLCSYDCVRNDRVALERAWDLVILDEAQRIKNRDAGISRACKRLRRMRSWALTGTPLENREDELASVLEFVRPNPEGQALPTLSYGSTLRARHAELQLRRRKVDVLTDLPPKWVCPVLLELGPSQRAQYREAQNQGRASLERLGNVATTLNVLQVISRLKQICNFCPASGESCKMVDLKQRLEVLSDEGHKALVFSQWTSELFGVERLCRELARFSPLAYTGAMDARERTHRVTRFQADTRHKALVLSLRAGGQGLNLQEASYVVHFDRWWNPAVENQATDRAHRMGQTRGVTVYTYTCSDTIEERIEQILESKRRLFQLLVDEVSLDPRRLLSQRELFGLLDLPAPQREQRSVGKGGPEERLFSLLAQAGWTVDGSGLARHADGRTLRVVCSARPPVPTSEPRLILIPERLGAQELSALQEPLTTVWGLDELALAESAFTGSQEPYSPK